MSGTREVNSNLDVSGNIKLSTVPNNTGTLLTYNASTKLISTRTNTEILSDLGLTSVVSNSHTHANKAVLDTITNDMVAAWETNQSVRNYAYLYNIINVASTVVESNAYGTYVRGTNGVISLIRFSDSTLVNGTFEENVRYTLFVRAINTSGNARLAIRYTDGTATSLIFTQGGVLGDAPTVQSLTSAAGKTIDYIYGTYGSGGTFYIYNVLLIKGTKFPGWIPAPEDQVSDYNQNNPLVLSHIKNKPDFALNSSLSNYLLRSGGTMTGNIDLNSLWSASSLVKDITSASNPTYGLALSRLKNSNADMGLGMSQTGDLIYGEWSKLTNLSSQWNKVWHSGNLTNLNQLTNGPGYLTTSTLPNPSLITSTSATGTSNVVTTNANTYLNVVFNGGSIGSSSQITGAGSVTVASDATGKITITGTNTTYGVETLANLNTGTSTTGLLQSAKNLNDWLNAKGFITTFTETDPVYTASIPNQLMIKGTIPAGADLNNYTTTGIYNQGANTVAETFVNSPTVKAMTLEVVRNSSAMIWQKVMDHSTNRIYTRNFSASWSSWKTMALSTDLSDYISTTHVVNAITSTNISNWNNAFTNNHTHSNKTILDGTQESFTTVLKNKLDGLSNYVLPTANASVLGGIKVGANLSIDSSGVLSATDTNTTYTAGTGISQNGTVFGQTITTSGTGTFITSITQTTNGFQVNLGTPTNTTYTAGTLAVLNTGTATTQSTWTSKILNDWLVAKGYATSSLLSNYLPLTGGSLSGGINFTSAYSNITFNNERRIEFDTNHTLIGSSASTTAGFIYLRPRGINSDVNQVYVDTTGMINTSNGNGNSAQWQQGYIGVQNLPSTYVPINGITTINNTKTFSSSPIVPNGTLNNHAVNLGQLNSAIANISSIFTVSPQGGIRTDVWTSYANSPYAISIGHLTGVTGTGSIGLGYSVTVEGMGSINSGFSSLVVGSFANNLGAYNTLKGANNATTVGTGLYNTQTGLTVVGRYNEYSNSYDDSTLNDDKRQVFVIGAGNDTGSRKNIMTSFANDRTQFRNGVFYDTNYRNTINFTDTTLVDKKWVLDNVGSGGGVGNIQGGFVSEHGIDLRSSTYNPDLWYAVAVDSNRPESTARIRVDATLGNSGEPSWSTHASGFVADFELETIASGWGTTTVDTRVIRDNFNWVNSMLDSQKPVGYQQDFQTSTNIIWLRGGGLYAIRTDYTTSTPTIRTGGMLGLIDVTPKNERILIFKENIVKHGILSDSIGTYNYGDASKWKDIILKQTINPNLYPGNTIQSIRLENAVNGANALSPILHMGGNDVGWQLQTNFAGNFGTGLIQFRSTYGFNYGPWKRILTTDDLGSIGGGSSNQVNINYSMLNDYIGGLVLLRDNLGISYDEDPSGAFHIAIMDVDGNLNKPSENPEGIFGTWYCKAANQADFVSQGVIKLNDIDDDFGLRGHVTNQPYLVFLGDDNIGYYYQWFSKNQITGHISKEGGTLIVIGILRNDSIRGGRIFNMNPQIINAF